MDKRRWTLFLAAICLLPSTLSAQDNRPLVCGTDLEGGVPYIFGEKDDPDTRIGFEVFGTNTELEKLKLGPCLKGVTLRVTFTLPCNLCAQEYSVTAASHDPDGVWHDWMEDAVAFSVADNRYTAGVANLRAEVGFEVMPAD